MTVQEFLRNEIHGDRMNIATMLTVKLNRKNYLCTIQECSEMFGRLIFKDCKKKVESNSEEMNNSFTLKVSQ